MNPDLDDALSHLDLGPERPRRRVQGDPARRIANMQCPRPGAGGITGAPQGIADERKLSQRQRTGKCHRQDRHQLGGRLASLIATDAHPGDARPTGRA